MLPLLLTALPAGGDTGCAGAGGQPRTNREPVKGEERAQRASLDGLGSSRPTIDLAPGERSDPGASLRPSTDVTGATPQACPPGGPHLPSVPPRTVSRHETPPRARPGRRTGERSELLKPLPKRLALFQNRSSSAGAVVVQVHRGGGSSLCSVWSHLVAQPRRTAGHHPAFEVRPVQGRKDSTRSNRGAPGD